MDYKKVYSKDYFSGKTSFFWRLGYGWFSGFYFNNMFKPIFRYTKKLKTATLKINVTETNFNKVEYLENGIDTKFKVLCTSLSKGLCVKPLSFTTYGNHTLTIKVSDKASHEVSQSLVVSL